MTQAAEWVVVGLLRASLGLSVAALLVGASVRLTRLRAPRAEQWAWLLVLLQGVVVAPLPIPIRQDSGAPGVSSGREPAGAIALDPLHTTAESGSGMAGGEVGRGPALDVEVVVSPASESSAPDPGTEALGFTWSVAVLSCWLSGVVALLGLGTLRYGSFVGRLRRARSAPVEWQAEWRRILDEQAVGASISLFVSRDAGPALCRLPSGYCLVVPEPCWTCLAPAERGSIMRHELAHYRRGDLWTTLLARGLGVVQWFNPLAWWAVARFEAQSEFACDLAATPGDPSAFAETLMRLASVPWERIAVVQAARAGRLFERIQRLLTEPTHASVWRCAFPIAVAIVVLGPAAMRIQTVEASRMAVGGRGVEANAPGDGPPLPTRALVQLGAAELRTRSAITDIRFAPGGRLIAAAESNSEFPRISIFDVRSGRLKKLIAPAVEPPGSVQCLTFSPDGTRLLWGETNGQVGLWDLTGDRLLFRERIHGGGGRVDNVIVDLAAYIGTVNDVAFSPDGLQVATASTDGWARLRRIDRPREPFRDLRAPWSATGRPNRLAGGLGPLPGPQPGSESAERVTFTPEGRRLVVGSATTISIWRIEDGQLLRRIERAHGDLQGASNPSINSLAVTSDGRLILSAGDCTVPVNLTSLAGLPKNVASVTLSEVRLWNLESGERVKVLGGEDRQGLGYAALSQDGRRVAVADIGSLRILDATTGRVERMIESPGSGGARPAFSPDGSVVAHAIGGTVAIHDLKTGRRLHDEEGMPRGEPTSAAWSSDGRRVVLGYRDGGVRVWEVASGKRTWHKPMSLNGVSFNSVLAPNFVGFSGDDRFVVAAGGADRRGRIAVYEANGGTLVREVDQPEITQAALSPDGRILVVASSPSGSRLVIQLRGIEVGTGRTHWSSPPDGEKGGWLDLRWMKFRPNSASIELAQGNGEVIRLNAITGGELRRSRFDWRPRDQQKPARRGVLVQLFHDAAFSDGGRVLASFAAKAVSVWDVEAGALRRTIQHPHGDGCFLAVSPDGNTLATSVRHYLEPVSEDKVRLYDVATGEPLLTLEPRDDRAVVLAFSPDGTKLLAGFHRGTAIVWDVRRRPGTPRPKG